MATTHVFDVSTYAERADRILKTCADLNTSAVTDELERFRRANDAWKAAHEKVHAAKASLTGSEALRGERDAVLDSAIRALAKALEDEGFEKLAPDVVELCALPPEKEIAGARKFVIAVLNHEQVGEKTRGLATEVMSAADGLEATLAPVRGDDAGVTELVHEWEKAFSLLRLAAQYQQMNGGAPLYSAWFADEAVREVQEKDAKEPISTVELT